MVFGPPKFCKSFRNSMKKNSRIYCPRFICPKFLTFNLAIHRLILMCYQNPLIWASPSQSPFKYNQVRWPDITSEHNKLLITMLMLQKCMTVAAASVHIKRYYHGIVIYQPIYSKKATTRGALKRSLTLRVSLFFGSDICNHVVNLVPMAQKESIIFWVRALYSLIRKCNRVEHNCVKF